MRRTASSPKTMLAAVISPSYFLSLWFNVVCAKKIVK